PSRWKAAVSAPPLAPPSAADGSGGRSRPALHATDATTAPTSAPTSGKRAAPRPRSRSSSSSARPTGIAVRNARAAAAGRTPSRIDGCVLVRGGASLAHTGGGERRHVGEQDDRRPDQAERERRTRA